MKKKKKLAAIFAAAAVKESIGATIRIGQEILCLPYMGFFLLEESLILLYELDRQWKGGTVFETLVSFKSHFLK